MRNVYLASIVGVLGGCVAGLVPDEEPSGPVVNIQVTEYKDADAFEKIISQLEARNIKATVLTNADFATQNCERIKALANAGFEIMAFARPEPRDGESLTLSMLTYEEQEELITGLKTAIETCLGEAITGFRCTRFDQNEDTYQIVDELGFDYNLGFVARTERSLPGHENDVLPYRAADRDFWAVPMHSVDYEGSWKAFCDNPFRNLVDAAEWEQFLKGQLDQLGDEGRPLVVEFHPYYSGVDEGRFNAFVSFLDYAVRQSARFVTVAELVERSQESGTSSSCSICDAD